MEEVYEATIVYGIVLFICSHIDWMRIPAVLLKTKGFNSSFASE
jgi:hypothetical protein